MARPRYHPLNLLKRLVFYYLVACLLMWAGQRHFLYLPNTDIQPPATYGLQGFDDVRLQSSDGTAIQLWHHAARAGYPTILYFHGNAGNLSNRVHYDQLLSDAGFGIVALSYRGYGASGGSPSEAGFYDDARAAMAYATGTLELKPTQIVVYGESIGTGVAVQMATEFPEAALVLQSPYTSIEALAKDKYPWLPVHFLLKDRFNSLSKIPTIHAPLLVFHGEKDAIIPIHYARQLFDAAPEPKKSIYLPENGHVDFDQSFLTQAVLQFCREQHIIRVH